MWILVRALTYSTLFIGFLLIFLPARLLAWTSISPPANAGVLQLLGLLVAGLGGMLAAWCILTFVFVGKGTPAPFDPPRRLVIRGPYRLLRNPMYAGAVLVLAGAALSYGSVWLVGYAVVFGIVMHGFVVLYEEPKLRATFRDDYTAYCGTVGRWLPKIRKP